MEAPSKVPQSTGTTQSTEESESYLPGGGPTPDYSSWLKGDQTELNYLDVLSHALRKIDAIAAIVGVAALDPVSHCSEIFATAMQSIQDDCKVAGDCANQIHDLYQAATLKTEPTTAPDSSDQGE
jgi:hypothetical protein